MPIHWEDVLPSTQDEAHRLAEAGATHGTAVAAREQSEGRGTRGRQWVSGRGGLWLSVVCRPEPGSAVEVLGIRVGLAVAELLDSLLPPPTIIALKWPNDILLGGEKIGGILAEARWQGDKLSWVVVGVGLNLNNPVPVLIGGKASRLADAGIGIRPADLAPRVAEVVAAATRKGTPLTDAEVAMFRARDWLRGRTLAGPEPGLADGITPTGRLRVKRPDGTIAEHLGSIQLALGT